MLSRISRPRLLAAILIAAPATALAQVPLAPSNASGAIKPPAQIDPGMVRPVPSIPARSMPVIHPKTARRTRHGSIQQVPK